MRSDVQVLVDDLAGVLGRSVTLRDADNRFITYSGLVGETDERRREWILTRGAVNNDDVPLRDSLPGGRPSLTRTGHGEILPGSLARVLAPVWHHDELLGALSVIDEPRAMTPEELRLVEAAAAGLSALLLRDHQADERLAEEQTRVLGSLLAEDPVERHEAVAAVEDREMLSGLGPCTVLVVRLHGGPEPDDGLHEALRVVRECLRAASLRHGVHRSLSAVLQGRGVLLLLREGDDTDAAGRRLHEELDSRLGALPAPRSAVVASADPRPVGEAYLAYEQALRLARVATAVGGFRPVVSVEAVGVYDVLARLPSSCTTREALPAGLVRLLDRPGDGDTLLRTLECYLDHAGNAVAAAQELMVHRGTLYYRLERIEDVAGVLLRDGMQRLSLHVGIKLARLAGIIR